MKILYYLPNPDTIYAGKTIYHGYKHAFEDLGHDFKTLTPDYDQKKLFEEYKPDILMTSISSLVFRFLDLDLVKKQKKKGMKVFVNTPYWNSPISKLRINETPSLKDNKDWVKLIASGEYGDIYYNVCEQGDSRMKGFKNKTGYDYHTILLATDKTYSNPKFSNKFFSEISYIGTYLPAKRAYMKRHLFPLGKKYDLRLYGQDWNLYDRFTNFIQKVGQYFNIPYIKSFKKNSLSLYEERQIYKSSVISLNIHEDYQKKYPGDLNERTFKIPASGGFEITDYIPSLKKYFVEGKEIVIAKNTKDWFEKIEYYLKYPEKRAPIIKAGQIKVLKYHTYHNRVKKLLNLFQQIS
ncbi:glycosyltransferase family 1 protein [Candidatus Roizmanbacteria bacterium]|nr:glycosyltransferase family 1 protein [Candidatus Roizmanbacteria bacterium]